MRTIIKLLLLLLVSVPLSGINLKAGVGYSALSQKYVLFEEDTLSTSNEGKLFLEGNVGSQYGKPGIRANWLLSGGTSSFLGRGWCRWKRFFNEDLSLITELSSDFRKPYEKATSVGYFKGSGFAKIKRDWDETSIAAKIAYENKVYSGESSYSYDYSLSRFRFDVVNPFFGNDELDIGYQFAFRFAPDTIKANYIRNNFYITWDKFWDSDYIRADVEAERRVYNRSDLYGNNWHVNGYLSPSIGISKKLTLSPRFIIEGYRYDWANETHPNRETIEFAPGIEWNFSSFVKGELAPKYLINHADKEVTTDNYQEFSAEIGVDWLQYKKIWFFSRAEIGKRIYKYEPPEIYSLYSDFMFIEGSMYLTWWLVKGLRFDLMASYTPEWHDIHDDDLTTLYFSTNLRYEFLHK
ncbi:hypothetical protein KAH81_07155 [bacterium]|nr:hypothetical protein [bacterium]